jgi:hypothetical protein
MAPVTVESLLERNKSVLSGSYSTLSCVPDALFLREVSKDWQARPLFAELAENTDPNTNDGVILIGMYTVFLIVKELPITIVRAMRFLSHLYRFSCGSCGIPQIEAYRYYSRPLIHMLEYLTTALDRVLVMRTPGGRVADLPNAIFAIDTWINYKDIMIIHHSGMHPISHHLY